MADFLPPAGFGLPDENQRGAIIAGTAVTTFLAAVIVAVRFWVRTRIVQSRGWDDYWVLAAMVSPHLQMLVEA
jgi:hypothetical protein